MRRKDREITRISDIKEIISQCKICRVAIVDNGQPYIVPLNFGWSYENERFVFYFHSAKVGRKITAIKNNPEICIEMDCNGSLIEGKEACDYSYYYKSIIAFGKASVVDNSEEKEKALSLLMYHQTGKQFNITDEMSASVLVFKTEIENITGKGHI